MSEEYLGSTEEELNADFKRSYRAWLEDKQDEEPTGMDFPELTDQEMDELRAAVHAELGR